MTQYGGNTGSFGLILARSLYHRKTTENNGEKAIMEQLLNRAKLALRISCSDFDSEIQDLIEAALEDLRVAGIVNETTNPLIIRAVITYVKLYFGDLEKDDYERLLKAYETQKGTLFSATGYTDWGDTNA